MGPGKRKPTYTPRFNPLSKTGYSRGRFAATGAGSAAGEELIKEPVMDKVYLGN